MIQITDTITVLRDGEVVGQVTSAETDPDQIRMMMVGRQISGDYYRDDNTAECDGELVLSVRDLSIPGELENISFDVHAGEILGFCGLSDAGIHSVGKAVYGLESAGGSVHYLPTDVFITSAPQALANHIGYVPKDRDREALMIRASIRDNSVLPSVNELRAAVGLLRPARSTAWQRGREPLCRQEHRHRAEHGRALRGQQTEGESGTLAGKGFETADPGLPHPRRGRRRLRPPSMR
jgi:ribose transport system ATP-binding protein